MIGFSDTRGKRGLPAKIMFSCFGDEIRQLVQFKLVNSNAFSYSTRW